jgi:hypothetical protein
MIRECEQDFEQLPHNRAIPTISGLGRPGAPRRLSRYATSRYRRAPTGRFKASDRLGEIVGAKARRCAGLAFVRVEHRAKGQPQTALGNRPVELASSEQSMIAAQQPATRSRD